MPSFRKLPRRLEDGQGLVEYALLLVLVALAVIIILSLLGKQISLVYGSVVCALDTSGDMVGFTVSHADGDITVTVSVRRATTITISGDVSGGGSCSGPACTFTLSGPPKGSLTVEAANGSCTGVYSW
jgi:pilus assembly protein Flp/PilA